jgi:hypothetical protein
MRRLTLLALLVLPASIWADDYLIAFSADGPIYRPTKGHTFAALVTVESAADGTLRLCELHSISWLPASGKVRALAMKPEQGRNVPLEETLRTYSDCGSRISMWGPYRVQPEFACLFKERVNQVEGTFAYKAASFLSPKKACDCARAVEEMIDPHRRMIGYFGYGACATSVVVQKASPWIVEGECPESEIATLIGLDAYSIQRRPYGDFTSKREQFLSSFGR